MTLQFKCKKSVLAVYKALDSEKIGIIIGLKEGQFSKLRALELRKSFQEEGKSVQLIALTDITDERLQNFKDIDVFVQVAVQGSALTIHLAN